MLVKKILDIYRYIVRTYSRESIQKVWQKRDHRASDKLLGAPLLGLIKSIL